MGIFCNGNDWATSTTSYTRNATDHSVSFWARLDDSGAVRRPFGNTGAWEMRTSGTTLVDDLLQSGTTADFTMTVGTYHHIVMLIDVTNTDRFAYRDGGLVTSVTTATFAGVQIGTMNIAVAPGGAGQGWFGALDDLRIYDRLLSAGEIETIYTCRGTDGIIDGLAHWWPMDEGVEGATITNLVDVIGGINCSTINNTPVYNYDAGIRGRRYI